MKDDRLSPWTTAARDLVFRLARARAERDEAQCRCNLLRDELLALVPSGCDGFGDRAHRAVFRQRGVVSWRAIAMALGATHDLILSHRGTARTVLFLRGFGRTKTNVSNARTDDNQS